MNHRDEIRDFLRSRRAALTPMAVGLPPGARRRVPGLRRGEVAELAGVSVEYFSRLERGQVDSVTGGVLDAVAGALRLDDDERAHLHSLVRAAREGSAAQGAGPACSSVRAALLQTVRCVEAPVLLVNARTDIVGANIAGRALYAHVFQDQVDGASANYAAYVFLTRRSRDFYLDWAKVADEVVATLHHAMGLHPGDGQLTSLIADLRERSEEFRARWSDQTIRRRSFGVKKLKHPSAGLLTLSYESLQLPADPGLVMMIYSAEPGSPSEAALRRLLAGSADSMSSIITPSGSLTTT